MKKKVIITVSFLAIFVLLGILYFKNNFSAKTTKTYRGLPVDYFHATYAYDTSTLRKAIGSSNYVFIGRINKIIRTEYANPVEIEVDTENTETVYDPYTIYSVNVIKNIKGNLITNESIELMQFGGINYDKKSYSFLENSEYLNDDEYYILMPTTIGENGLLEVSNPNKIIKLGSSITDEKINKIVDKYSKEFAKQEIPVSSSGKVMINNNPSKYDLSNIENK